MVATSRMWVSFCVLPMHARPGLRGEIPIRRLLDTQLVFRGPIASAAIGIGAAHESTVLGVAVRMRSREVVDVGFGVDPHDGIAAAAGPRLCLAGELIVAPRRAVFAITHGVRGRGTACLPCAPARILGAPVVLIVPTIVLLVSAIRGGADRPVGGGGVSRRLGR